MPGNLEALAPRRSVSNLPRSSPARWTTGTSRPCGSWFENRCPEHPPYFMALPSDKWAMFLVDA
jgi:hypothetical protein